MARSRVVKPGFFRSIELYRAEIEANKDRKGPYLNIRVAYAGLWTSADREGRFKWMPEVLKLDCLPYDNVDFNEVLGVMQMYGTPPLIQKYTVNGQDYGLIPTFKSHQRPHPGEVRSLLPGPDEGDIKPPAPKPKKPRKPKEPEEKKPVAIGPTERDTPAQQLVWHLAHTDGHKLLNEAQVKRYFAANMKASSELVGLCDGNIALAKRAITDIWAWLNKQADAGKISHPRNMFAVCNNFQEWHKEYNDRYNREDNETLAEEEF